MIDGLLAPEWCFPSAKKELGSRISPRLPLRCPGKRSEMNSPRVTGQELSPSRACGPHTCQITEGNSSRSPWEREEPVPGPPVPGLMIFSKIMF